MKINGIMVQYYIVCKRELWFFSHKIHFEEDENILLGRLIHEKSYQRQKKNILIDDTIALDFLKKRKKILIFEIKKSSKLEKPVKMQVLYYLWYLKHKKGLKVNALIVYPKERKQEKIILTSKKEKEIEMILKGIEEIVSKQRPPKPEKRRYCRKCSYFEFCWVKT